MFYADVHMWLTFAVILSAIILYALDRIPMELTSLIAVVSLLLIFSIFPLEAPSGENLLSPLVLLAGFANPALISVLALLVMGQGLFHSGALEGLIDFTTKNAVRAPIRSLFVALALVLSLSALLNNTPVVLMFIPVLSAIILRGQFKGRSHMLSLSFVSILGGMLTLIGSSTNLLVASTAFKTSGITIGFFDQTIPGIVLMVTGILYIVLVMPFILGRETEEAEKKVATATGRQFIIEVRLRENDALVGAKSQAGFFAELGNAMTLQMIEGRQGVIVPPFDDYELQVDDRLYLAATRREISDMMTNIDHPLASNINSSAKRAVNAHKEDLMLAELVVAPGSRMTSRAVYQTGFSHETRCMIVGVQRRARMLRHQMSDIRLESGDVLLVMGTQSNIEQLRGNRDALLMEWSAQELPNFAYARRAQLIFAGTIFTAAAGLLPIVVAALAGAALMLASGVINIRQAGRGIDLRIYMLVGAALAMSEALMITGGATFTSTQLLALFAGQSVSIILSIFFIICAIVTNILSNNATAVLFTPIAINLSSQLGVDPTPFIFAVIFAANCSFATPMAYQTNLLIMSPGNYKFIDFVKTGVPLILIIWATYSFFAPVYFGL